MDKMLTDLLPARVRAAIAAVSHPTTIDAAHWTNAMIVTALCFLVITLFHRTVGVRFKKQYFACHVFANAIITYCVLQPSIAALVNPQTSTAPRGGTDATSQMFMCWCLAIHVYHPIFFRTGAMDWIHHVPVYILNTLMMGCLSGEVFCLQACIMTGIPGGLDYLLLVLEGEKLLSRATYKSLSAYINNWFRAPLGFISGYTCLVGLVHQWDQSNITVYQKVVFGLMGIHGMWNPPFFGRQTIEANIVDIVNRFDLHGSSTDRKKAVSLGKVRALSGRSRAGNLSVELEAHRTSDDAKSGSKKKSI
jgi:hypothetical protein